MSHSMDNGGRFRQSQNNAAFRSLCQVVFVAFVLCVLSVASPSLAQAPAEPSTKTAPAYAPIAALFREHCLDCHADQDPEGQLVLETFKSLMKGGEAGPAVLPKNAQDSLLVKFLEGRVEKDGKKLVMPPGSKRRKLTPDEIGLVRAWIDAGAPSPAEAEEVPAAVVIPKIAPKTAPRNPIHALAYAPKQKWLAVGRYGAVELRSAETRAMIRAFEGHRGNVQAIVFSADGGRLFSAGGEPGLIGETRQWNTSDGSLVRVMEGHRDAIYALALSPDGKLLATGSYDQKIKLWNLETGEERLTLSGHNGCIYDLAFRPDGKILASASADRTVKLWEVASGQRRDTLSQALLDLHTVVFSPDGQRLLAAGMDNRIRVWQISSNAVETTNPLLISRFAHEGAILHIAYSEDGKSLASTADDRTVKIWDATGLKERHALPLQPDWAPALTFALDNKVLVVGRLDGSLEFYNATSGAIQPPPAPVLAQVQPRGVQRGLTTRLKLTGSNLAQLVELKLHHSKLTGALVTNTTSSVTEAWIDLTTAADLPRGRYEISVAHVGGESGRLPVHVDDLPQLQEPSPKSGEGTRTASAILVVSNLPASAWGVIESKGDADLFEFDVIAGQTLVLDVAAQRLGSKAVLLLTLTDSDQRVVASNSGFDGSKDPFLAHTFTQPGRYQARLQDINLNASPEHFYRISIGALPMATAAFPLSVAMGTNTLIQLTGANLPPNASLDFKPEKAGAVDLPLDPERYRTRRNLQVLVTDQLELLETEPNSQPAQANPVAAPCVINGQLYVAPRTEASSSLEDVDLFRFESKAGRVWVIETDAARRGSPADTRLEVLHPDGSPVERLLLQAVRDSAVNFRPTDANQIGARLDNWEEMELTQFMYWKGEVVRLFRMPQGPDSEMQFFASGGKRRAYFDTTAVAHALEEHSYIVDLHPPGTRVPANGLPTFVVPYANDDDGERKLGADSRILFTAPKDGAYLVRVSEARGVSSERHAYRLILRHAEPSFSVTLTGANPSVNAGSGRTFSVTADRIDGFDGDITVRIEGLPPGFAVTSPLMIQAGHAEAKGTLFASPEAKAPDTNATARIKVTASAQVNGQKVEKPVNSLGQIKVEAAPKLFVRLEPAETSTNAAPATADPAAPPQQITIAPGQTIPAWLRVRRNGHEDLITFDVENLPHGVIVDNIGLSGVLMPKGENEREIFLTCYSWVPETDRLIYAIERQAGNQTSLPVLFKVRKPTLAGDR